MPAIAALIARRAIGNQSDHHRQQESPLLDGQDYVAQHEGDHKSNAGRDGQFGLARFPPSLARRSMIVEVGFRSKSFVGIVVPDVRVLHLIRAGDRITESRDPVFHLRDVRPIVRDRDRSAGYGHVDLLDPRHAPQRVFDLHRATRAVHSLHLQPCRDLRKTFCRLGRRFMSIGHHAVPHEGEFDEDPMPLIQIRYCATAVIAATPATLTTSWNAIDAENQFDQEVSDEGEEDPGAEDFERALSADQSGSQKAELQGRRTARDQSRND